MINIDDFSANYTLLDSNLYNIKIYLDDNILYFDLIIRLRSGQLCKLSFIDLIEYSLNWNSANDFYIVSDYIFVHKDNSYYLSLDPYDSSVGINPADNDFIRSKHIAIEITEKQS